MAEVAKAYRKVFVSFADSRMRRSLDRIRRQASDMEVYDSILVEDESSLYAEFREKFSSRLRRGTPGYGYWVWKPQIILQAFEGMADGDVVHYSDAGSWLNPGGRGRLLEYFRMTSDAPGGILAFQVKNTFGDPYLDGFSLPEYKWTKGDLFDYFGVRKDPDFFASEQIGAGNIFFRKCRGTETFLREWLGVFEKDFSLVDDTPSVSQNFEGFVSHRHDQSVFGLLCKLHKVETLSAFEYWYPSNKDASKPDWDKLADYPVWAKRDKSLGPLDSMADLAKRAASRLGLGMGRPKRRRTE